MTNTYQPIQFRQFEKTFKRYGFHITKLNFLFEGQHFNKNINKLFVKNIDYSPPFMALMTIFVIKNN